MCLRNNEDCIDLHIFINFKRVFTGIGMGLVCAKTTLIPN